MEWWSRGTPEIPDLLEELRKLRRQAALEPLPPLTKQQMVAALCTFSDRTGKGLDAAGPRFFKHLPGAALEDLVLRLRRCEEEGVWPWQVMAKMRRRCWASLMEVNAP